MLSLFHSLIKYLLDLNMTYLAGNIVTNLSMSFGR
jgi:hypothetical protein